MKRIALIALFALLSLLPLTLAAGEGIDFNAYGYADEVPALRDVFADDFKVGAAINTRNLTPDSEFCRLVSKHYNAFVLENEMKPENVNPAPGAFLFGPADRFVAFGEELGATLRGHTLVWHSQVPAWWFKGEGGGDATREELLSRMEEYISTVVGRYKGRIAVWDVVNEAFSDQSGLRRDAEGSKWASIIGDIDGDGNDLDYIEQAFSFAHEADPDARLILNDYSLEGDARKLDEFYEAVRTMLEKGVPIGGAGIQAHIQIGYPSVSAFEHAIEKLVSLREIAPDFVVQVTELDVSIFDWNDKSAEKPITPELQKRFAERYADLFEMFRRQAAKGNLDMVVTWGAYDANSWLNGYPVAGRTDAPLLFDRQMRAKPAFWGLVDRSYIDEAVDALP